MKKTFNSTCSYCGVGCGVTITRTDDGRLTLEGNPNTPASRGMLCSKGLNLHHVVSDHSDRILKPQMRYARHLPRHEVSWEDAIKRSAAVFKTLINKYGADSVGLYVSGQMLTEEYYLANKLCKGFLGTNNIDTNSRLCMSTAVASYKKALGEDAPPISYEDIEACSLFFIAGANPAWCHPIIFRRIEAHKAENPDVKIICVDPRRTQTAEMADLHLQIKPGTDIYLYNAIAALIFAKGYADQSFMEQHVDGFEELKAYLQSIDLHQAAQKCEIKYADIILAADMIGQSETLLTMWAMGLNQSSIGVNKNLALINLSLITGRIGKPGCGPFSLTGQGNAMGGREVGGMATMLAAHRNLDNPDHIREVADFWGVKTLSDRPGYSATEMVEALEDSRLKAVWIVCTNPAVSLPSSDRVDAAFKKAKFVMVSEISNRSDTLAYADVILPAAGWLEKEGVMTNSDRHLSYLPKVVDAPGEALPDSEIFIRFAREMGFGKQFSYRWPEDIFNEHRALTKGTNIDISGITYQRLKKNNIQWPCPDLNHPGSKRLFEDGRYWTASQNAQVFQIAPENTAESISKEYPDFKYMQTENKCGEGENNWSSLQVSWETLVHYLNHSSSSYMYWNMVLDQTGKSSWGWPQNSMVVIDEETKDVKYTDEFYLFKHLSHFVQPGDHLLKSSQGKNHLAFQLKDGRIMILINNQENVAKSINLMVGVKPISFRLKPMSINTLIVNK